jgi:WD40 repeat protein
VAAGVRLAEWLPSLDRAYRSSAAFAATGRHVVASRPGGIVVLDLADGSDVRNFAADPQRSGWRALALSPNADLVSADDRGRIDLYGPGGNLSLTDRHTDTLWAVAFGPGGPVATATLTEVLVWHADTGSLSGRLEPEGYPSPAGLAFSPGGRLAVPLRRGRPGEAVRPAAVAVWGDRAHVLEDVPAEALAWIDDRTLLVAAESGVFAVAAGSAPTSQTEDGEETGPYVVTVCDVATGAVVWVSPPVKHFVGALAFAADGRTLATACGDGTALLWSLGD